MLLVEVKWRQSSVDSGKFSVAHSNACAFIVTTDKC